MIEPAESKWAIPVVFVPKIDESLRFFVYYRRLNEAKVAHTYPIPCMND